MRTLRTYARLDMSADPDSVIPIEQAKLECEPLGTGAFEAALTDLAESTRHPARTFAAQTDRTDAAPANPYEDARDFLARERHRDAIEDEMRRATRDMFTTIAGLDQDTDAPPALPFSVRWAIDRARADGLRVYPIAECQSFGEPGHIVHVLRSPGVCYVVVEDDHYGGGRPRLFHLPDVVHLLQNVTEPEARAIVSRPPR